MNLVFSPPTSDTPGFLRRAQRAIEFKTQLNDNADSEMIERLVEFLLPYVKEPVDRTEAKEALCDATEEQLQQLIGIVIGNSAKENPTPAQETKEQSNTGPMA